MAVKGEILFETETGELEGPRENKTSLIFEFSQEVYLPGEVEENKVHASRRIGAFEVTKNIDRITPLLYKAVCEAELCTKVTITLYRIAEGSGEEEAYFRYVLEEARIVSVRNWMPPTFVQSTESIGHLEKIKILPRKISWEYLDGGILYLNEGF
jgi:type VI secretion system secreted protein Hcp